MTAMSELRARTAQAHAGVDRTFGAYDLTDRGEYSQLLLAHARALPVVEDLLDHHPELPPMRTRTGALLEDLSVLEVAMPWPMSFDEAGDGARGWGIWYVVEGSRLGGAVLADRVGRALPTAYLAARHEPGEWRAIGAAINAEAIRQGAGWLDEASLGATACFDLFHRAATYGYNTAAL